MKIYFLALTLLGSSLAFTQELEWQHPEEGIAKTTVGNDIWIFKIDQNKNKFKAVGNADYPKPLTEWGEWANGSINLNMFSVGGLPNGYFKLNGKVIQPNIINYNAFIVWDDDTLRIMDRSKESMKEILSYPNVSQNIRMVSESAKRNRWQVDEKKWSVSVIATTTEGDVLFIHSRYPYTMHDFINLLVAEKELKIYRMAYLEGGPESSIAIYGAFSRPLSDWQLRNQRMGSYETGFREDDTNTTFWHIPWALCFAWK
jgi:hypothetical protein